MAGFKKTPSAKSTILYQYTAGIRNNSFLSSPFSGLFHTIMYRTPPQPDAARFIYIRPFNRYLQA